MQWNKQKIEQERNTSEIVIRKRNYLIILDFFILK